MNFFARVGDVASGAVGLRGDEPTSPARQALDDLINERHKSESTLAHSRAGYDRLRAALEPAETNLRSAQGALSAVADQEADDLATWSRAGEGDQPAPRRKERSVAEKRVNECEVEADRVRRAMEASRPGLQAAQGAFDKLAADTAEAILKVLTEIHAECVQRYRAKRAEFVQAAVQLHGLPQALAMQGRNRQAIGDTAGALVWLKAAERLSIAAGNEQRAEATNGEVTAAATLFAELVSRLRVDPNAVL